MSSGGQSGIPTQQLPSTTQPVAQAAQTESDLTVAARPHARRLANLALNPFGLVGILQLPIYGVLLWWTRGLPYVLDNNESFSALWHAANMYNFGFNSSFGLTDEAISPAIAAHPYIHTHQGNFPRIFAFILYVFGAR